MNPLLGGCFSLVYGAAVAADAIGSGPVWRTRPAAHASRPVPVMLAVRWGSTSRVMDGAGSALQVGLSDMAAHRPVITLAAARSGPVLVPALAGLLPRARPPRTRPAAIVRAAGILLGLFLLYFVRISEASWVGFRAGQILLVSIPILLARDLRPRSARACAAMLAAVILGSAFRPPSSTPGTRRTSATAVKGRASAGRCGRRPTSSRHSPGYARTRPRPPIVQMEPMVRGREHWTLIPSFAGRRMAAGLPISLLPLPEYLELSERGRRSSSPRPTPKKPPRSRGACGSTTSTWTRPTRTRIPTGCASSTSSPAALRAGVRERRRAGLPGTRRFSPPVIRRRAGAKSLSPQRSPRTQSLNGRASAFSACSAVKALGGRRTRRSRVKRTECIKERNRLEARAREAVLEHVTCAVCGGKDYDVVLEARNTRTRKTSISIQKFRASGDELLIDQARQVPELRSAVHQPAAARRPDLRRATPRARIRSTSRRWRRGSARSRPRSRAIEKLVGPPGTTARHRHGGGRVSSGRARGAAGRPKGASRIGGSRPGATQQYGVRIRPGSVFEQNYEPASFDVVTLWDVIEHTTDPRETLEHCRRLLKPGGVLVVNYPDIGSWIARALGRRWLFLTSVHLHYFDRGTMTAVSRIDRFRGPRGPPALPAARARLHPLERRGAQQAAWWR